MENEQEVTTATSTPVAQQLTVVVLGAIAGFLAGKAVEKGVNAAATAFRNR